MILLSKTKRFTREDYMKAIADLQLAMTQLEPDGNCCAVCGDDGHMAWACHHNPLACMYDHDFWQKVPHWKCFHCGVILAGEEAAREHFGEKDGVLAACLVDVPGIIAGLEKILARVGIDPSTEESVIVETTEYWIERLEKTVVAGAALNVIHPDVWRAAFDSTRSRPGMGACQLEYNPYTCQWEFEINYSNNLRIREKHGDINEAIRRGTEANEASKYRGESTTESGPIRPTRTRHLTYVGDFQSG